MGWLQPLGAFFASIPGFFTALWGSIKTGSLVGAGYVWRGLTDAVKTAQTQQAAVADFQDGQRRLRVDPDERERLRQQSGKPPGTDGG